MSSVQLHLALTHVPVILSFIAFIILLVSFFIKNETVAKVSYYLLVFASITAIPVFLTGEGAEEAVENLPGVSEAIIEKHEGLAKFALIAISASGLVSLVVLFLSKPQALVRLGKIVILLLAIASSALMLQTAHLGGQIRHTEIRSAAVGQNGEGNTENGGAKESGNEDDDD
ncbi:MAG: hypothetical protein J0M30_01855 [Chitinophagales bacterium]|nr:hypothetical protein [Chitinophagales bacterium]